MGYLKCKEWCARNERGRIREGLTVVQLLAMKAAKGSQRAAFLETHNIRVLLGVYWGNIRDVLG